VLGGAAAIGSHHNPWATGGRCAEPVAVSGLAPAVTCGHATVEAHGTRPSNAPGCWRKLAAPAWRPLGRTPTHRRSASTLRAGRVNGPPDVRTTSQAGLGTGSAVVHVDRHTLPTAERRHIGPRTGITHRRDNREARCSYLHGGGNDLRPGGISAASYDLAVRDYRRDVRARPMLVGGLPDCPREHPHTPRRWRTVMAALSVARRQPPANAGPVDSRPHRCDGRDRRRGRSLAAGCEPAGARSWAARPSAQQLLIYPMLDRRPRPDTPTRQAGGRSWTWTYDHNVTGLGGRLLGDTAQATDRGASPYAAPPRPRPPIWTGLPDTPTSTSADLDDLPRRRDSTLCADRLSDAGWPYPQAAPASCGCPATAFEALGAVGRTVSQRAISDRLRRHAHPSLIHRKNRRRANGISVLVTSPTSVPISQLGVGRFAFLPPFFPFPPVVCVSPFPPPFSPSS